MQAIKLQNNPIEPFFTTTPKVVGVEITGRCPLRCRHCFNYSGPENQQELSLNKVCSILDEMLQWNVKHIRISGGEPTYHKQFKEVITACAKRNISIAMNTNGVYSPSMLEFLKTAPIDIFMVSIDGLQNNNDAIRGKGIFQRAIKTCEELHASSKRVILSYHVGAGNQADVTELIAIAASINIDFKLAPIRPIGRANDELPNAVIAPADYLNIVRKVVNLRKRYPHINIYTDFDILDGLSHISDCQTDPNKASCKAGRTMININYDGEIYPCAFFATDDKTFSAGNISNISLSDAWKDSKKFLPFRVQQKSTQCQSCNHYQSKCYGGCPAIAHFSTGYLDALDPTCFADLLQPPQGEFK